MKKTFFAAFMAFCLLAGSSAFAQQNRSAQAPKERPTAEQMAQHRTERMTKELGLNEAQAKQVYALNLQQAKAMEAKRDDKQADRQKMQTARQANDAQMKSILTADQYTKWSEMQNARQDGKHGPKDCKSGKCGKDSLKCGDGCHKGNCNKSCPKKGKE